MYRLLIVTRDPRVEDMFASMQGWEAMGFKQPRLRKTVDEAKECMKKHHIDAIAIDSDPDYAELDAYLDECAPHMPIFEIAADADRQMTVIREIELLLNQLHTDDSNDDYDEGYYFQLARDRWMKRLISGMAPTKEYILTHQRMYRCPETADQPCVFAQLSAPRGDEFLTGRWHYGSERLETALRNFFGAEHDHMSIRLAVVSPEEVRVLISATDQSALSADKATHYIKDTIEQVEKYLGFEMDVEEIRVVDGLTCFASQQA